MPGATAVVEDDGVLVPAALTALTLKIYEVLFVKLVTVTERKVVTLSANVDHEVPEFDEYSMM
jgi:hypothetical protein